jgi:hypothetical protein
VPCKALHLGQLLQPRLDRLLQRGGIAAGRGNQLGRHALRIVDQHLQEMFRRQPLMATPLRQSLCGLKHATGTLTVNFAVHCSL